MRLSGSLMLCLAILSAGAVTAAGAGPVTSGPAVQITLKQQLEKGLKCRRPLEFEFVDRVAQLVAEGKLPIKLVNSSYAWSRQQNGFRPFVYFQRSLIKMAARQGIVI